METLNIKKEDAIKAHENANSKGKKLLVDLFGKKTFQGDVIDRIQSFDDVLEELGIDKEEFESEISDLPKDEQNYRKLKLVVSAYNEGRKPNWRDTSEDKWEVWISYKSLFNAAGPVAVHSYHAPSSSHSYRGSRLAFRKYEHAMRAGELFVDLWRYWFIEE